MSGASTARCPPDKCSGKREKKQAAKVAGQRAKVKELLNLKESWHTTILGMPEMLNLPYTNNRAC